MEQSISGQSTALDHIGSFFLQSRVLIHLTRHEGSAAAGFFPIYFS